MGMAIKNELLTDSYGYVIITRYKYANMRVIHLVQFFAIAGLVALNVGTFKIVDENRENSYNAQLKGAWEEEGIERTAMRASNIYSITARPAQRGGEIRGEATISTKEPSVALDSDEPTPACDEVFNENAQYKAELVKVEMPESYEEKEFVRIKVTMKNTGETAWYSSDHGCGQVHPVLYLGNEKNPTEAHTLWNDFNFIENNWAYNEFENRIELSENKVEPGKEGTFSFWVETPIATITTEASVVKNEETGTTRAEGLRGEIKGEATIEETKEVKRYKWAYEKYTLTPVIGAKWLSEVKIPVTFKVGELPPKEEAKIRFLSEKLENYKLKDYQGEKNIYLRLSDQRGFMRYGDKSFYSYIISSGAWDTKTPTGDHKIYNKQELRIAGKAPYYRMPYWMGLNINGAPFVGYGLHEVPYLGTSRETSDFYARGLKYDLGKNVSHGCVRSGDKDAPFVFEFGELGMPVYVRNSDDEKVFATIEPAVKQVES